MQVAPSYIDGSDPPDPYATDLSDPSGQAGPGSGGQRNEAAVDVAAGAGTGAGASSTGDSASAHGEGAL